MQKITPLMNASLMVLAAGFHMLAVVTNIRLFDVGAYPCFIVGSAVFWYKFIQFLFSKNNVIYDKHGKINQVVMFFSILVGFCLIGVALGMVQPVFETPTDWMMKRFAFQIAALSAIGIGGGALGMYNSIK